MGGFYIPYFTDRDGKYQLKSLAESSFDPLARTCRLCTEEAHVCKLAGGYYKNDRKTLELMKNLNEIHLRQLEMPGL